MLSPLFYNFYRAAAVVFFAFGTLLFVFDDWSAAERFPWWVTPFVMATWGMWWIGHGVYALEVVRVKRISQVAPCLMHLWLLPIFELAVVVHYRENYQLGRTLSAAYLVVLLVAVAGAVIGAIDLIRQRPNLRDHGPPMMWVARGFSLVFIVAVMYLGYKGLTLRAGGYGTEAKVFPDPLRLISARTFGAFYLSVALSALPVLFGRTAAPLLNFGRNGMVLIVLILIAAVVHLDRFDFVNRPGGLVYIGAYVAVAVVVAWVMWRYRRKYGEPVVPLFTLRTVQRLPAVPAATAQADLPGVGPSR